MKLHIAILVFLGCSLSVVCGGTKHGASSRFPSLKGLVMCGYQGWFRAQGDGSGQGWVHYGVHNKVDPADVHIDLWPDVSEYKKVYSCDFTNEDGTTAQVFSSWDQSTVDLHFRWMQQYGIDGVFVQRFFSGLRTGQDRLNSRVVLEHALIASQKFNRAVAVMYDLSGLRTNGEDCSDIIQDWKELVDQLRITSQGTNQTYLYDNGKPVVAIWGLGFPDRPYNLHNIGIEKLIDFLKNDPNYGGCAVMLGVPTYFRTLTADCLPDSYLHKIMKSADIIMPWMVGRFTPFQHDEPAVYAAQIRADIAWCNERHLEYVPCVYPGFSWHNLSRFEFPGEAHPPNQIPRLDGRFYWSQVSAAIGSGAKMLYVAMFDEMDEGTAIFKCTDNPPMGAEFVTYGDMPSDYYLWLTGEAGKMLRGQIPFSETIPPRTPRDMAASNFQ